MADSKRTVAQDKANHQAAVGASMPHDAPPVAPPAPRGEPVHSPMLDRDRERLAYLRSKLPPLPQPRTLEEEEEMHLLERRLEKAAQSEWAKQDARVLELQQNDHRTPEEEAELARLVREIDLQDRAVKRAEAGPRP